MQTTRDAQQVSRILFLEPQPCIRALKYAIALKHRLRSKISICFAHTGYPLSKLYGFGEEYFDQITRLNPEKIGENIRRIVSEFKPQVIHSHNAPDTLTVKAVDMIEDIPVINDIHEVLSVHNSGFFQDDDEEELARYREQERKACEESDGRIYATEGIREYIEQQYGIDGEDDLVFKNYASESVMPHRFKEKMSSEETHIVYIGCITSIVEGSHYDLREIFRRIADCGFHIHLYPASDYITRSNGTYRKIAESNRFIHFHDHLDYRQLLYEITKYDFGWAGFDGSKNRKHLDIALQNKVLDYVSSGLPVIAFRHKAIQRFIGENGIGLIVKDVDELPELLGTIDVSKFRERVMIARRKLTFESNIPKIVNFYNRIAGTSGD